VKHILAILVIGESTYEADWYFFSKECTAHSSRADSWAEGEMSRSCHLTFHPLKFHPRLFSGPLTAAHKPLYRMG